MASDRDENSSRVAEILDAVMQMAQGNFDARAPVMGEGDEIDALAAGVSMLGEELAAKFTANEELTAGLEQALRDMERQHETILLLSTPALSVWDGILVVPLVGILDQKRASEMSSALLDKVQAVTAEVVIIDVTGLAAMDTAAAKHLIDTFASVSLLGSKCVLTGLSAHNAQNMAGLGVSFEGVETQRTLREGLRLAFWLTERSVIDKDRSRG